MRRIAFLLAALGLMAFVGFAEEYVELDYITPLEGQGHATLTLTVGMFEEFWYENIWTDFWFKTFADIEGQAVSYTWQTYFGIHFGDRKNWIKGGVLYDCETGWWLRADFHVAMMLPFASFLEPVKLGQE